MTELLTAHADKLEWAILAVLFCAAVGSMFFPKKGGGRSGLAKLVDGAQGLGVGLACAAMLSITPFFFLAKREDYGPLVWGMRLGGVLIVFGTCFFGWLMWKKRDRL